MSDLPIDWKLDIAAALPLAIRRATAAVKEAFGHAVAVASALVRCAVMPQDFGRQVRPLRALIGTAGQNLFVQRLEQPGHPPLEFPVGFRPDSLLSAVSQHTTWRGIPGRHAAHVCHNFAIHVRDLVEVDRVGGPSDARGGSTFPAHAYPRLHSWFCQHLPITPSEAVPMETALDEDEVRAINHGLQALQIGAPLFPLPATENWEEVVAELRKRFAAPEAAGTDGQASQRRAIYSSMPRSTGPVQQDLGVLDFMAGLLHRLPRGIYRFLVTPGESEPDQLARTLLLRVRNEDYGGVEAILHPLWEASRSDRALWDETVAAINRIISQAALEAARAAAGFPVPGGTAVGGRENPVPPGATGPAPNVSATMTPASSPSGNPADPDLEAMFAAEEQKRTAAEATRAADRRMGGQDEAFSELGWTTRNSMNLSCDEARQILGMAATDSFDNEENLRRYYGIRADRLRPYAEALKERDLLNFFLEHRVDFGANTYFSHGARLVTAVMRRVADGSSDEATTLLLEASRRAPDLLDHFYMPGRWFDRAHSATEDELRRRRVQELNAQRDLREEDTPVPRSEAPAPAERTGTNGVAEPVVPTAGATGDERRPPTPPAEPTPAPPVPPDPAGELAEPGTGVEQGGGLPAGATGGTDGDGSKLARYQRGPALRKSRSLKRNQLIDQAIGAGITDPADIFQFVREHDPSLVLQRNREITPESMMRTYERAKRCGDNCNPPG